MYIKKLTLSNFQVIKDFDAEFNGNVYFVTGDNELGKSTLLKAIGALLTGNRDEVLRNGEKKGFAKMVIGDDGEEFDVSLSFTEANPRGTLSIKQKSTGMQSNNVSMLQKIFGYQDFDAVEFSRWSETAEGRRKQIAVVKALLPVEVRDRIDAIDADVLKLKDERTGVNRDVKTYTAIVKESAAMLNPGDTEKYTQPIDAATLIERQSQFAALDEKAKTVKAALMQRTEQLAAIPVRIKEAKEKAEAYHQVFSDKVAQARKAYEMAIEEAKDADVRINEECDKQLATIEAERQDFENRKANAEQWLNKYEAEKANRTDISQELAQAEEHNRKCKLVADHKAKTADLQRATEKAAEMDAAIDSSIAARAELIANAKLPIKGLTFTNEGLELNGVPFVAGRVSDSQIMEIAAKLVIASNPKVKVFRIARGESLGKARLESIVAIAKKYGYQGFIEQVQRGQQEMNVEEYTED